MDIATLAVAAALLYAPPDDPIDEDLVRQMAPALRTLALGQELMDPREERYFLNEDQNRLVDDVITLRTRARDHAESPRVLDAFRFPPKHAIDEWTAFNRTYRHGLADRAVWEHDRGDHLRLVVKECDILYKVWDLARDAQCEWYYVTVRRQALKNLKALLGDENYATGSMPPYVPTWRFEDVSK